MNLFDAFQYPFIIKAYGAGVLLSIVGAYLGCLMVQRGLSFLGDGLAHAAFGGVALGLLLGHEPLWIAAPFTLLMAWAILWVRDRTQLRTDTAIGVFFALSVALGILFISLKKGYTTDAMAYLFGSIMFISASDLWSAVTLLIAVLASLRLWPKWVLGAFDREIAQTDGLKVRRDDFILMSLIAVTIVVAVKLVGMILTASFLIIPGATAKLLCRSFLSMTVVAISLAVLSVIAGLSLSIVGSFPSGATIILTMSVIFLLVVALLKKTSRRS